MSPDTTEGKSQVSIFFFPHASIYMQAGLPLCVSPDVDNQHISVTERAADHEGDLDHGLESRQDPGGHLHDPSEENIPRASRAFTLSSAAEDGAYGG